MINGVKWLARPFTKEIKHIVLLIGTLNLSVILLEPPKWKYRQRCFQGMEQQYPGIEVSPPKSDTFHSSHCNCYRIYKGRNVCSALNMEKPELVMASPERPNICNTVVKMSNKIHVIMTEYFEQLLQRLKTKGNRCDRCIIYCQTVNQCSTLFSLFSVQLGQKMYLHEDKKNAKERLVEMMHTRTPKMSKRQC